MAIAAVVCEETVNVEAGVYGSKPVVADFLGCVLEGGVSTSLNAQHSFQMRNINSEIGAV